MRLSKRVCFTLLPALGLLGLVEGGVRVAYFFTHHRDVKYLLMPFAGSVREPPVEYRYKRYQTYTQHDACSGREITFTANRLGGRGPDWTVAKPPGTTRLLAVGGSTTYGQTNPDWATYPALLDATLNRQGMNVEVLNAGVLGYRLETVVGELPAQLEQWHPDVVLYYEAFNNAVAHCSEYEHVRTTADRFHRYHRLGRLTYGLYGRSLLYTYLLEKPLFARAASEKQIVPEIGYFQTQLTRFVEVVREFGATPILILQVTRPPSDPGLQAVQLDDVEAIAREILRATQAHATESDEKVLPQMTTLRAFQTQVLVEVVRRTGEALGVQIVDPRPAFSRYQGGEPLFCDVIHLTDRGNQLLAEAIAEALAVTVAATQRVVPSERQS